MAEAPRGQRRRSPSSSEADHAPARRNVNPAEEAVSNRRFKINSGTVRSSLSHPSLCCGAISRQDYEYLVAQRRQRRAVLGPLAAGLSAELPRFDQGDRPICSFLPFCPFWLMLQLPRRPERREDNTGRPCPVPSDLAPPLKGRSRAEVSACSYPCLGSLVASHQMGPRGGKGDRVLCGTSGCETSCCGGIASPAHV